MNRHRAVPAMLSMLLVLAVSCDRGGAADATSSSPAAPATSPPPALPVASADVGEFSTAGNVNDPVLTAYAPVEPGPTPWPVVVFITGGGNLRSQGGPMSEAIAGMGAVAYTFSWSVDRWRWERVFGYVRCAIGLARDTAPDFGGDPSRLVLVGYSAGGALGMNLALDMEAFPTEDCTVPDDDRPATAFVGLDPAPLVPEQEFSFVEQVPNPEGAARTFDPYPRIGMNPGLIVRLVHGNFGVAMESIPRLGAALTETGYDVGVLHDEETGHGLMMDPTSPGGRLGLQALWEVLQLMPALEPSAEDAELAVMLTEDGCSFDGPSDRVPGLVSIRVDDPLITWASSRLLPGPV